MRRHGGQREEARVRNQEQETVGENECPECDAGELVKNADGSELASSLKNSVSI